MAEVIHVDRHALMFWLTSNFVDNLNGKRFFTQIKGSIRLNWDLLNMSFKTDPHMTLYTKENWRLLQNHSQAGTWKTYSYKKAGNSLPIEQLCRDCGWFNWNYHI